MAIYNQEFLDEYEIIKEMHFSKQDLQDPSTIDKILKRKYQFDSAIDFCNTIFNIINPIGSFIITKIANTKSPVKVSWVAVTILGYITKHYINKALDALSEKQYQRNIKKYKEKVNKLIEKMERSKVLDPANSSKYQEIIDNCKNVLKEFDRRENSKKYAVIEEETNKLIGAYNNLKNWKKYPDVVSGEELDMFYLTKVYGIPEQNIINFIVNTFDKISIADFPGQFSKNKEMFNGSDLIMLVHDDEEILFIVCNTKKLYRYEGLYDYSPTTLYKETQSFERYYSKEALIEFDKEMGFYKFSECPDNIKKKEFIRFK